MGSVVRDLPVGNIFLFQSRRSLFLKMIRRLIYICFLSLAFSSPVPQEDESSKPESGTKALFSLFTQIAEVVEKTGDVISKLGSSYTDMPELTETGEKISEVGESLPVTSMTLFRITFRCC